MYHMIIIDFCLALNRWMGVLFIYLFFFNVRILINNDVELNINHFGDHYFTCW